MGRLAVRLSVQESVQGAGIPYVGTVFPARPTIVTEDAYLFIEMPGVAAQAVLESEAGSACVVVVNIPDDNTTRYALAGRGARADFAKHTIILELFFASMGGEGVQAQLDYDLIVDTITTWIREHPTFAVPAGLKASPVWSAGEFSDGVKHEQTAAWSPEESTAVFINGKVYCLAWEQIKGTF